MSGQGRRHGPDGRWYRSQDHSPASTPSTPYGASRNNPESGRTKNDKPSFADRVTTTQAILAIIVSLITLGGSVTVAVRYLSHNSQSLTIGQVKGALLTSTDLALIDKNFVSGDVQYSKSSSNTCKSATVVPTMGWARTFVDKASTLEIEEDILVLKSSNDAEIGLSEIPGPQCSYANQPEMSISNVTDISNKITGLCAGGKAWASTVTSGGTTAFSFYSGAVRCGRAIVLLHLYTLQGSSYDYAENFVTAFGLAVPKVEQLPSI
jgi:hypothetical protein